MVLKFQSFVQVKTAELDIRLEKIGKPLSTNVYPRNKDDAPHKLL